MVAPHPPSLPLTESALATYLKAAATILPATFIWLFANNYMIPKLEWLWAETNLPGSKLQWLMDASRFLATTMPFVMTPLIGLFVVCELTIPRWPRWRQAAVSVFAVLIHTTVLLALTAIATGVLAAAPLLTRNH